MTPNQTTDSTKPSERAELISSMKTLAKTHLALSTGSDLEERTSEVLNKAAALLAADGEAKEWHDEKPDQWTPEVEAAHPLKTKNYKAYDTAMEMVGNRRNKHALVQLVCWLLQKADGEAGGEVVALRQENELLRTALRFYANGDHYHLDASEEFDTVSGEPQNWLCSGLEDSETMVEDGEVARNTLMGHVLGWEDAEEDHTPQPIAGEAPFSAAALQTAYNTPTPASRTGGAAADSCRIFQQEVRNILQAGRARSVREKSRVAGNRRNCAGVRPGHWKGSIIMRTGEQLARQFHEIYERLAPGFGYETRTETRQFDPDSANGRLMIAVCAEVLRITGDGRGEAEWYTGLDRHGVRHFYHRTEGRPSEFNDPLYATPPQQEQAAPAWEMPDAPDLFKLINSQSILQSLLYDLNLLPECCRDAMQWYHMVTICGHFEMALKKAAPGAVQDGFVMVPMQVLQSLADSSSDATARGFASGLIAAASKAVIQDGRALAMAVLQSDLYLLLDDEARAQCDAMLAAPKAQEPGA